MVVDQYFKKPWIVTELHMVRSGLRMVLHDRLLDKERIGGGNKHRRGMLPPHVMLVRSEDKSTH
jgi:hypothetical protein